MSTPPQTEIPDDLVPNASGYTREQLAIRLLASAVASLAWQLSPDSELVYLRAQLMRVLALTEPEGV